MAFSHKCLPKSVSSLLLLLLGKLFCIIIAKAFTSIDIAYDGEETEEHLRRKSSEMATTENKKKLTLMGAYVCVRTHAYDR